MTVVFRNYGHFLLKLLSPAQCLSYIFSPALIAVLR
jgi:hypothetical protein